MKRKEDRKMDATPKSLDFVGKPYTSELGRQMPYGALINFKGIIIRVMTERDYPEL